MLMIIVTTRHPLKEQRTTLKHILICQTIVLPIPPPTGPNGVMFMNFADYTDDVAMYMFTDEQEQECKQPC